MKAIFRGLATGVAGLGLMLTLACAPSFAQSAPYPMDTNNSTVQNQNLDQNQMQMNQNMDQNQAPINNDVNNNGLNNGVDNSNLNNSNLNSNGVNNSNLNTNTNTNLNANSGYPNVAGLVPFSPSCNFMSRAGYLRYIVYNQQGVWLTRSDAVAIVDQQIATGP
jgi:hypothetical protein